MVQKPEPFVGLKREYSPKDDAGEKLPGESQKVTAHVPAIVDDFVTALSRLFDVTATKVDANTRARADVVLDGRVVVASAPVELLLFIEKRLADCMTFVSRLPTLDSNADWHWDPAAGCWATDPVVTNRTKKVPKSFIKAPATDKHPAQAEMFMEDEIVGHWATTKLSGAVPVDTVNEYQRRISALQAAVKMAREEANMIEIENITVAKTVFDLLFAPVV